MMGKSRHRSESSDEGGARPTQASCADLASKEHLTSLEGKARLVINSAKVRARPELDKHDSWLAQRHYKNFADKWPVRDPTVKNNIQYVDMEKISTLDFERHFIKNKIPCMMLNSQTEWQATKKWTKHRLGKKYRNQSFKCGEVSK